MKPLILLAALTLAACSGPYKRPSANPAEMSAKTLCYRYAAARKSEAITNEITRRGLDCEKLLARDPLYRDERF